MKAVNPPPPTGLVQLSTTRTRTSSESTAVRRVTKFARTWLINRAGYQRPPDRLALSGLGAARRGLCQPERGFLPPPPPPRRRRSSPSTPGAARFPLTPRADRAAHEGGGRWNAPR